MKNRLKCMAKWLLMLSVALVMVLCAKTKALAATKYDLWIGSTQVTSENCDDLTQYISGVGNYQKSYFDPSTNTLYFYGGNKITSVHEEGGYKAKIYSKIPLTIVGKVYLDITMCSGIVSTSDITLNGEFKIVGTTNSVAGINAKGEIRIVDSKTTINISNTGEPAIYSTKGIQMDNGHLYIKDCYMGLVANNGYLYILNGEGEIENKGDNPTMLARKGCLIVSKRCSFYEPQSYVIGTFERYIGYQADTIINGLTTGYATKVGFGYRQGLEAQKCNVVFNYNIVSENTMIPVIKEVNNGDNVYDPTIPYIEGYDFHGWYKSRECKDGELVDFPIKAAGDATYYAKWEKYDLYDIWVSGLRVTSLNKHDIYPNSGGKISYDPASNTLTLNGQFNDLIASNNNTIDAFIYSEQTLTIQGENAAITTKNTDAYPIYLDKGSLTVKGKLRITGGKAGIYSATAVTLNDNNSELIISDSDTGIYAKNGVGLICGTTNIKSNSYGLYTALGMIKISGGKHYISGKKCAIYGGNRYNIAIEENVTVTEPKNYKTDKSYEGSGAYYTILQSKQTNAKDARIVIIDSTIPIYTVTFDLNGKEGTAPSAQKVREGKLATNPGKGFGPTGFYVEGWYKEKECTNKYDFATPVKSNITLYAKWAESDNDGKRIDRTAQVVQQDGNIPNLKRVGTEFIYQGGRKFRVTSDTPGKLAVSFARLTDKKATKVTVPNEVAVDGVTYKVTEVGTKAFSGCKKLKTVTLGANVETIKGSAFKGAANLRTIKIKSVSLTKGSVASKAFAGVSKNATISVPKKMKKSYTKLFAKKGLAKGAVIK